MTPPKNWVITKDNTLKAVLTFVDYEYIFVVLSMLARKSEELNHHAKITVEHLVLTLELTTWDEGNTITDKDIELATFVNRITTDK